MFRQQHKNSSVFLRLNNDDSTNFSDWFKSCFVPEIEQYLKTLKLDFKVCLVLDNALSYLEDLETLHPNVKVIFLPGLVQPMGQGVTQIFKLSYIRYIFNSLKNALDVDLDVKQFWENYDLSKCIVSIKECLQQLEPKTISSCWTKLWPGLNVEDNQALISIQTLTEDIIKLAKTIGFTPINSKRIQDVLDEQDVTDSDLDEMIIHEKSSEKMSFDLENLKIGLQMANELADFFMQIDPSMERSLGFKKQIMEATTEYRNELKDLVAQKQDEVLKIKPKCDNEEMSI